MVALGVPLSKGDDLICVLRVCSPVQAVQAGVANKTLTKLICDSVIHNKVPNFIAILSLYNL